MDRVKKLPFDYWQSFERAFYTIYLRAVMEEKLADPELNGLPARTIVREFTKALESVLRAAHGARSCKHHGLLFSVLDRQDAVLSFNYDLVAERALADIAANRKIGYGHWLYGLAVKGPSEDLPTLLKLHGSSNWTIGPDGQIEPHMQRWEDFFGDPGYCAREATFTEASRHPILLPFWDKPVEQEPWLQLWRQAATKMRAARDILVWGYSPQPTDLKAHHLFALSADRGEGMRLCLVDPSRQTQRRWRELLPAAQYWPFESMVELLGNPPRWIPERGLESIS